VEISANLNLFFPFNEDIAFLPNIVKSYKNDKRFFDKPQKIKKRQIIKHLFDFHLKKIDALTPRLIEP
jgi:hypothetical protein